MNEISIERFLKLTEDEQIGIFKQFQTLMWPGFAPYIQLVFPHLSLQPRLFAMTAMRQIAGREHRMWLLEVSKLDADPEIKWLAFETVCCWIPKLKSDIAMFKRVAMAESGRMDFRISAIIGMLELINYNPDFHFRSTTLRWMKNSLHASSELFLAAERIIPDLGAILSIER